MSIWTIINIAAWVLCAVFLYLILSESDKKWKKGTEKRKSLKRKTKRHTYGERKDK